MAKETNTSRPLLIGHTADNHLRDTQYAARQRGFDFFNGFLTAVDAICDNADVGVDVGDIFDKPRPSARLVGQLLQADRRLRSKNKAMFVCSGNHDWSDPSWVNTIFEDRFPEGGKEGEFVKIPDDATGIIPTDGRMFEFRGIKFATVNPYSASAFRHKLAEITVQVRDADVVLYHGLIDGIVPIYTGLSDPLTVDDLPISKNNKAWLLGDLHMPGFVNPERPGGGTCLVGYPGSTEMCSSSEPLQKEIQLVKVDKDTAERIDPVPIETRPYITTKVHTEEDLEELMEKVTKVASDHPVVNVEFNREVPEVINRLHSMLDAQRSVIRCYPLPLDKKVVAREQGGTDDAELTMDHFVEKRFKEKPELAEVALDLLHRDTDAHNIITDYVEKRKEAFAIVEED